MLSFCNQMSTSAGDLDLFKGVKKSLKNKRKKYAEAAVQTEIEQSSYVNMERSLERMRVEVEAVKGRAGREVQGLKEQVKGLMGRN
jgi:CRISPR/Cas system CSM-associated protein Csm2 small subunit